MQWLARRQGRKITVQEVRGDDGGMTCLCTLGTPGRDLGVVLQRVVHEEIARAVRRHARATNGVRRAYDHRGGLREAEPRRCSALCL